MRQALVRSADEKTCCRHARAFSQRPSPAHPLSDRTSCDMTNDKARLYMDGQLDARCRVHSPQAHEHRATCLDVCWLECRMQHVCGSVRVQNAAHTFLETADRVTDGSNSDDIAERSGALVTGAAHDASFAFSLGQWRAAQEQPRNGPTGEERAAVWAVSGGER